MPIFGSFAASGLASKILHSPLQQIAYKVFRKVYNGAGVVGSTDGSTWSTVPSSTSITLYDGAWASGNGTILVNGSGLPSGSYNISVDNGLSWDRISNPSGSSAAPQISFVDGYFYMPGTGTNIYRSANGISWTTVSGAISFVDDGMGGVLNYFKVLKIAGKLVIPIAGTSKVQTSTNNGVTWTASADNTIPVEQYGGWLGAYSSSIAVIVSSGGYMAYSTNGTSWTQITPPGNMSDIAYGNGKFIGVGSYLNLYESTDGINWTALTAPGYLRASCTFADGKFYLLDYMSSAKIYYSTDGATWTTVSNTGGQGPVIAAA